VAHCAAALDVTAECDNTTNQIEERKAQHHSIATSRPHSTLLAFNATRLTNLLLLLLLQSVLSECVCRL
jgi:hypothetical protein